MEQSNKQENQGVIHNPHSVDAAVLRKADREIFINAVTGEHSKERMEQLSNFIISLLNEIQQEPYGAQHVQTELELNIEELFKRSDAFCLALDLYAGRFQLRGGKVEVETRDLETILQKIVDTKLRDPEEETPVYEPEKWTKRFGAMISRLYDDLSSVIYESLSDEILDLTDSYTSTVKDHAEFLLPVALDCTFSAEPDTIKITTGRKGKDRTFCSLRCKVREGIQTLLLGLDEICKPYELKEIVQFTEEDWKGHIVLSINIQNGDEVATIHSQAFPTNALDTLGKFIRESFGQEGLSELEEPPAPPPAKEATPETPIYRLCQYGKLRISFYLEEDGDETLRFDLERSCETSTEAEIYFNTFGVNRTNLNRDRYMIPLKGERRGEVEEDVVLSGSGEILFVGYKDTELFRFRYDNTGKEFEGQFSIFDAKGNCVQSLFIYE